MIEPYRSPETVDNGSKMLPIRSIMVGENFSGCPFSPELDRLGSRRFASRLTLPGGGWFFPAAMLHQVLKSKIYKAVTTDSIVEYEGSIEIPRDLMEAAGLWEGEKVLVASLDSAARLETYVLAGEAGTGRILVNGGAAHRIKKGERLTIMAFGLAEMPVVPKKIVLDAENRIERSGR
ncbi:aspartate 1-decarboxylase [Haloferula sp.]|uniref:aspartate 1-decarboxylase n=1 Tax=Haloferula sp. TaxID=2497595 RepID=UPI003C742FF2